MSDHVSTKVKNERYGKLMRTQVGISLARNQALVGQSIPVLIEEERDGWSMGRSYRDAPEIDGVVFVEGEGRLGQIVNVTIDEGKEYDLIGRFEGAAEPAKRRLAPLRMVQPTAPR